MDTTAMVNCQTHWAHEARLIAIDGWRLADRVRQRHLIRATGLHSYMFITAADHQRLLFSPFHDQWLWQLDCRVSPRLASQKWRSSAGFSTKGRCVVDKTHEICVVFQSNATRIRGNTENNTVLFTRDVTACIRWYGKRSWTHTRAVTQYYRE